MASDKEDRSGTVEQVLVAIIEDNREIAGLYAMLVKVHGMRISFITHDGNEAVEALKNARSPPDILLIDHRMPEKSGLEAMKEMLVLCPGARFIFISADEGVKDEAMAAGAKVFLQKPAGLKEIYDAMIEVLSDGQGTGSPGPMTR